MKFLLNLLLMSSLVYSQNLDSLYNAIISLQQKDSYVKDLNIITENNVPIKCGFGIIADAKIHFDEFSTEQQNKISKILSRPERQKSLVSPAGLFRIHYDTTGLNTPNYFYGNPNNIQLSIDSLAMAFDSTYFFEVDYLNYNPPPNDDGDGGDNLFDIYITNLGYYGFTEWELNNNNQNKSYIEIDNNMNFYTNGINAVRATAAHEFHHAIQVGSYSDNMSGNTYYFELTSTSMEEFVFSNVNDYYGYLSGFFNNPGRRFTFYDGSGNGGGYDRSIWNIFLKEKFEQEMNNSLIGFKIIKRTWELMKDNQNSALKSIDLALSENGLSIKNTFAEFAQWVYFTGYRTKQSKYFSEANKYPLIKPMATYKYQSPKKTYMMTLKPMANNFVVFDLSESGINDTLVSIVTNCDLNNAVTNPYSSIEYNYSLLSTSEDGSNEIFTGYYSKLESENIKFLKESDVFNNEIVNGTTIKREEIDFAYPQPFDYSKNKCVFFPTKTNQYGFAKLTIYSINMDLIYNDKLQIYNREKIVVLWDGKNNNGNKVASGIYIYMTESGGKIVKGKIAIIN